MTSVKFAVSITSAVTESENNMLSTNTQDRNSEIDRLNIVVTTVLIWVVSV